jgi:hypothetical protein
MLRCLLGCLGRVAECETTLSCLRGGRFSMRGFEGPTNVHTAWRSSAEQQDPGARRSSAEQQRAGRFSWSVVMPIIYLIHPLRTTISLLCCSAENVNMFLIRTHGQVLGSISLLQIKIYTDYIYALPPRYFVMVAAEK